MKNLLRLIPVGVLALVAALNFRPHQASVPFTRSPDSPSNQAANVSSAQKERVQNAMAALPTMFERNQGQFASPAQYIAHGADYSLALSPREATLWLASPAPSHSRPLSQKASETASCGDPGPQLASAPLSTTRALRMTLVGANDHAQLHGQEPLATKVNYFVGKDPNKWQRDIKTVGKVKYDQVYPGIDLVYYGQQGQMEYDFLVAPGANPNRIKMSFAGMERLELNGRGELLLHVGKRTVTQHAPIIYQTVNDKRQRVEGHYVLLPKNEVGFQIGAYNTRSELVIDPTIKYSTFLSGGESRERNDLKDVAVDKNGDVYIVGDRLNVAGTGLVGQPPTFIGASEKEAYYGFFVAKFKSDLSGLQYLTWISGTTNSTDATALAVDGSGQVHVVGATYDPTIPTPQGFQTTIPQAVSSEGACHPNGSTKMGYYAALNAKGDDLVYGTFIGGLAPDQMCSTDGKMFQVNGDNICNDIVVRGDGLVAITGNTNSFDLPVINAVQPHLHYDRTNGAYNDTQTRDAFVLTLKKGALAMLTYLGSQQSDYGSKVAFAPDGTLYAVGAGYDGEGSTFPSLHPLQATSGALHSDGYLTHLDIDKGILLSSTFLGTPSASAYGVACDPTGNVYVAGNVYAGGSSGFPGRSVSTLGPGGGSDIFIARLNPGASSYLSIAQVGGSGFDLPKGIVADADGNAYVGGETSSIDFPIRDALVPTSGTNANYTHDFLIKVASNGQIEYSTRLGGSSVESFGDVALSVTGELVVTGSTASSDFPVVNPIQGTLSGNNMNGFLTIVGRPEIVVNSTGDKSDSDTSDGACNTGGTVGAGETECTLRAAIEQVNAKPALNEIKFKIAVSGTTVPSISITKQLPAIIVPLKILGETQPTTKRVQINGAAAGTSSGLIVDGGGSTISGVVVSNFKTDGILLRTKGGNTVQNCFIGTDAKGAAVQGNGQSGLHTFKSPSNLIGGTKAELANIISGNTQYGVWIEDGASKGNLVQGNLIGTNFSGTSKIGKQGFGVYVGPAQSAGTTATIAPIAATIGGTLTGAGNVISGNTLAGIAIESASGSTVQGNLVGTDKTGLKALGNGEDDGGIGIVLSHATNNQIGGTTAGARNVASGNVVAGIRLFGARTSGNHIEGNFLGTDRTGLKALGNGSEGITLVAASGNFIGGPNAEQRNVISGNKGTEGRGKGVFFVVDRQGGFGSNKGVPTNNLVRGNFIGTDATGTKALPNAFGVIVEGGAFNTLQSNVIAGNINVGVVVTKGQTNLDEGEGTTLQDNLIGTDPTGTKALANGLYGVMLLSQKNSVLNGNTISGNGRAGVMLAGKLPTDAFFSYVGNGNLPVNAVLTGNFIGTNKAGTAAIPNGKSAGATSSGAGGIVLFPGVKGATIGTATTGGGNVIAGNVGAGVLVAGSSTSPVGANTITSNFIGTNSTARVVLANTGSGIRVQFGQGLSIVGNTIAANGGDGVTVPSGSGNNIQANAIFSNKLLGIDLKGDGVTVNRAVGTPDNALPNLGQNFPELISAQVTSGQTTVQAALKGAAKARYRIEFFLNSSRDPSGYGEGQKFVSALMVATDGTGTAKFTATLAVALSGTQFLSMTATDAKGNTSEFSGVSRAVTGQVFRYIPDPQNAKSTIKQGLANVRIERLNARGVVQEATGTDANGFYVFVAVPVGTWTIKPSSKTGPFDTQFDPLSRSVTLSTTVPAVSGVDFATYSIYGVVKDVTGKPLANQPVSLAGLNRSVRTARDGTYRFEGLGKGAFNVEFSDAFSPKVSVVTLPTGRVAGVSPNARVDAQQGLSLSGRVTDAAGAPLVNVRIDLVGSNISPVVTDTNGVYEFNGLPAGAYRVAPTASAGKFNPSSRNVTLKDKNLSGVDFAKLAASPSSKSVSGGDS